MIYDANSCSLPERLKVDLCVIGSGAGGAAVAATAAEAGLGVLVLEAGPHILAESMNQREEDMYPLLYWESGARTTKDRFVHIHQGRNVGGSTVHNENLCKRVPPAIYREWREQGGLETLGPQAMDALYTEVEEAMSVGPVPRSMWNRHNLLLEEACGRLGWRGAGLSDNRTGCIGSGYCEIGCTYDAKNNAAKVWLPRAIAAGAQVLAGCQATRIVHKGAWVEGVEAVAVSTPRGERGRTFRVEAPRVCVSASATGTPALLRRSKIPDPSKKTGNTLRIHPAVVVAAEFDEPIEAWKGIPQTYECTELLNLDDPAGDRIWIVPVFAHPMGLATQVPGYGAEHSDLMKRFAHLGALTAMVHDTTQGKVRPKGDLGLAIDYWPNESDRRQLMKGAVACVRLWLAAGAKKVVVPSDPPMVFRSEEGLDELAELELKRGMLDITAVHPMSSVPMGDDPQKAPVSSTGRHHHIKGLWVGDGSLFPTSIGGPPQLTIYALGVHVGRDIAST